VKRRLVAVLAGGLGLLAVSSCATIRPNAAKVDDVDIRRDEFERDMQQLGGPTVDRPGPHWLTDRIRFEAAARRVRPAPHDHRRRPHEGYGARQE
jgi:hypothetical protein